MIPPGTDLLSPAAAIADRLVPELTPADRARVAGAFATQWERNVGRAGLYAPAAVHWVTWGEPPEVERDEAAAAELLGALAYCHVPPGDAAAVLFQLTLTGAAYALSAAGALLVVRASPHRRRFLIERAGGDR